MHSLGFGFYWFFFIHYEITFSIQLSCLWSVWKPSVNMFSLMFLLFLLYLGRGNISSHSSHKEKDFLATYQSTGQVNAQLIGCDLGCIRPRSEAGSLFYFLPHAVSHPGYGLSTLLFMVKVSGPLLGLMAGSWGKSKSHRGPRPSFLFPIQFSQWSCEVKDTSYLPSYSMNKVY